MRWRASPQQRKRSSPVGKAETWAARITTAGPRMHADPAGARRTRPGCDERRFPWPGAHFRQGVVAAGARCPAASIRLARQQAGRDRAAGRFQLGVVLDLEPGERRLELPRLEQEALATRPAELLLSAAIRFVDQ